MEFESKADRASIKLVIDKDMENFFKKNPTTWQKARERTVEAMGRVWADQSKQITRDDHHIDTGAYINSIGYPTSYVGPNGQEVGRIIHDSQSEGNKSSIKMGSGVVYAQYLEKRYNIFARGLDAALDDMATVGYNYLKQFVTGGAR